MSDQLAVSYDEIRSHVAMFLGYPWEDMTQQDSSQTGQIAKCLEQGMRMFYSPENGHSWSFLTLPLTVTLNAGSRTADLPLFFSGLAGDVTPASYERRSVPIRNIGPSGMRQAMAADPEGTGPPQYVSIQATTRDSSTVQGMRLTVHPIPDVAVALTIPVRVNPMRLAALCPYPLGGVEHGQTIIAACLAAAEILLNDQADGPNYQQFVRHLQASTERDRRHTSTTYFGYNGDQSDRLDLRRGGRGDYDWVYDGITGTYTPPATEGTPATGGFVAATQDLLENALSYAWGGGDGVIRTDGNAFLTVTALDSPVMAVNVASGYAFIDRQLCTLASTYMLAVNYAESLSRIDLVQFVLGSGVQIKTGTPHATPVEPAADDDAIKLAIITHKPGETCIKNANDGTNAYITDRRTFL